MILRRAFMGVAATAVLGAALLAQAPPAGKRGMRGPGMGNWSEFSAHRLDRLAEYLGLTDQQKADAKAIFDKSAEQMQGLATQLRENRQAISGLVQNPPADFDVKLQDLASKQGSLTSQMVVLRAKTQVEFRNLLTPEQKAKADQLRNLFGRGGRRRPAA
jgi:Spy/CpxP family protein refolding chaperone